MKYLERIFVICLVAMSAYAYPSAHSSSHSSSHVSAHESVTHESVSEHRISEYSHPAAPTKPRSYAPMETEIQNPMYIPMYIHPHHQNCDDQQVVKCDEQ